MPIPVWVWAALLLVIKGLVKLSVDRVITGIEIYKSVRELPVDIMFLSMSFVVAHLIKCPQCEVAISALLLLGSVVFVIPSVAMWRRSDLLYYGAKKWEAVGVTILNYVVCLAFLCMALGLLIGIIK